MTWPDFLRHLHGNGYLMPIKSCNCHYKTLKFKKKSASERSLLQKT
jgi:hypothetical protein